MEMIDAHCHYEDGRFDGDRDEVIASLPSYGIVAAIDAGCSVADSERVGKLADKYKHIYFCAGVHPEYANEFSPAAEERLKLLWAHKKCVAVGEIGLDYHYEENPAPAVQREAFVAQLHIAEQINKPAVIHTRDAVGDMLDIIKAEHITGCLMHCFSESRETAAFCLDRDMYFSFGGVSTFKNARRANENLSYIPRDRILLETDCPYLAPEPVRGTRNFSGNIAYICEHIAMLWNTAPADVARITTENARRFYRLDI